MTLAPIALAAVGNAEDPATWSGTPYHFLDASRLEGLPITGLRFDLARMGQSGMKARWVAGRLAAFRAPRGMQYSERFLRALWASAPPPPRGTTLMNCSQLYPEAIAASQQCQRTFFLDQTLGQLFDYYEHAVAPDIRASAVARERDQYAAAEAIILQSRWAADDVIESYGIDPGKVHVVIPGANLDARTLVDWEAARSAPRTTRDKPLVLGFVGKDWQRKGLDRLINALGIARAQGAEAELHVVGCDPAKLPTRLRQAAGVRWLGFIDKREVPRHFVEMLETFDIGCLASRREAGGISLLEFARLGIPTLAPDTGGAPEYVTCGATTLIAPEDPPERLAASILALATDRALFASQREAAWEARHHADWRRAAREVRVILEGIA